MPEKGLKTFHQFVKILVTRNNAKIQSFMGIMDQEMISKLLTIPSIAFAISIQRSTESLSYKIEISSQSFILLIRIPSLGLVLNICKGMANV